MEAFQYAVPYSTRLECGAFVLLRFDLVLSGLFCFPNWRTEKPAKMHVLREVATSSSSFIFAFFLYLPFLLENHMLSVHVARYY
jgi:hypothetical protein